jgi:hypothetical protein
MITPESFLQEIEALVKDGLSYIDAITAWTQKRGFEPEFGAEMANKFPSVLMRLRMEAETLNLIKT